MQQNQGWKWGAVGVLALLGACDQELELPAVGAKPMATPVDTRPPDGVTGAAGAPNESVPSARLPVPDEPLFTTFAGAAGDGGTGGTGGDGDASGGHEVAGSGTVVGGRRGTGGGGVAGTLGAPAGAGGDGPPLGSGGAGGDAPSGPAQLLFSEYVEGSGSFKALEIYSAMAATLEGCELQSYFNGKTEPSRLALHGDLPAGGVYVLCSSALAAAQPALCSRSTSLTFNGDDALALSCGGVVLDVIGEVGVDPGDSWAQGATADHTLRRRCSVWHGRTASTPFEVDAEWVTFGIDTFSDLGQRSCDAP